MGYAGRQSIYKGTIRRMVTQALKEQEDAFRKEHEADADGQLLAYLQQWAAEQNHVPWPEEIPGGTVIAERFGSWESALAAAKLPCLRGEKKPGTFQRIKLEEERQKEIYRRHKTEKKALAEQKRIRQATNQKEHEKK